MSSSSSSSSRKITIKSMDGEAFEMEEVVAMQSNTIKDLIEDDRVVTLPSITGKILAMVIDYCEKHAGEASNNEDHLRAWDAEFVKIDHQTLFDLILAANFLNIKSLLDLTCQAVADMIKGKTPDEIRKAFDINNAFTPEEEEEVRSENAWAFE